MEGILRSKFLPRVRETSAAPVQETDRIIEDIKAVLELMDYAERRFNLEQDEDLLEACIYENKALSARYRYLIKMAKRKGISYDPAHGIQMEGVYGSWDK
ncbi:YaaL family protein [Zongyangia hominis]|uniref:DUF2508 family protein n=1 Tax=Zongyangia hominis TaxID=2763677 RepID=A0A926I6H5_9FIRM|nr:YaaL family protein [Zongyangia hominis]MBC8570059.1 DUF2508 family protein [Zongyangia hominis]